MARPRGARARSNEVLRRLGESYPGSAGELCALRHDGPFQLLVATVLSAQCTDQRVNSVTPALFGRYPSPAELSVADPSELEALIRSTGFFRAKAEHLIGMAKVLSTDFDGEVPSSMADLVTLPGVGRKTANVVLSVAFDRPGLPVDTHVGRLAKRLGLSVEDDPVKVEADLCSFVPEELWGVMSIRLILHGRKTCVARRPLCDECVLADICPSAVAGPGAPGRARRSATL